MLEIRLLGGFQAVCDGENITERFGGRAQSLLAFLLLHRATPQPRHYIAFTLWPDSTDTQARTNLRYVLHALRQTFPMLENYLAQESQTLHWRPDPAHFSGVNDESLPPIPGLMPGSPAHVQAHTLDVAALEHWLALARNATQIDIATDAIRHASALYRGDLLPGFYDDWVDLHRESLRSAFLDALAQVATRLEQAGDYRGALEWQRKRRTLEPLDETIYGEIMRLHWRLGDRGAVKRTYEACAAMLREELDVEPGAATVAGLQRYLSEEPPVLEPIDAPISAPVSAPISAPISVPNNMSTAVQTDGASPETPYPAMAQPSRHPIQWVPNTKVAPPQMRPDAIVRPRLEDALVEAFGTTALSLVSAPAGYGKTTLLAAAVAQAGLPCAWLSMDEDDNDPQLFFYGLVAALRRLAPGFGVESLAVVDAADEIEAGLRRVIGVLVNELCESLPDRFVLVLDDLHGVENVVVQQFLSTFFDRLPPYLHVAIGARFEPPLPWARWRGRQRLFEFGPGEMAFQLLETATLLNDTLRLGLSAQDLTTLHAQTEGWAAGLRLLAGSLVTVPVYSERSALIEHLSEGGRHVFDLLAEEVLRRQEPEVQDFLVRTSMLPILTPALCRAVTGRDDAAALLANLYRRNLFLIQLDQSETGRTQNGESVIGRRPLAQRQVAYRYHALFADFLQGHLQELDPGEIAQLYRRAADGMPERAISLYLHAELWESAAERLEAEGDELLRQGLAGRLSRWLHSLPRGLLDARPRLLYMAGVCAWMMRALPQADLYLNRALAALEAQNNHAGQGAALAYLAQLAFFRAEFGLGLERVARALAYPIEPAIRIQLLLERARIAQFQSNFAQGEIDVREAYGVVQATRTPATIQAMLEGYVPGFAGMPGGPAELDSLCRLGQLLLTPENRALEGLLYEQQLVLYLTQGELMRAAEAGAHALRIGERLSGRPIWQHRVTKMLTLVALVAAGHQTMPAQLIDQLIEDDGMLDPSPDVDLHPVSGILYHFAHSAWRYGRVDVLERVHGLLAPLYTQPVGHMTALALWMLEAVKQIESRAYTTALAALEKAAQIEADMPMHNLFGSAHALAACVHARMGNLPAAMAALDRAFVDVQRQSTFGRILLERPELDPLLARVARHDGPHAQAARRLCAQIESLTAHFDLPTAQVGAESGLEIPQGEQLSPREQEVLAQLATGAGNQAIAEHLHISVHTVKRHVANILDKLGLASRAEAVAYYHSAGRKP